MGGFISGLSILFHRSIFVFVPMPYCPDVVLLYSLKSGRLIPPVSFFSLRITLAIQGLLCFHTNCKLFGSSSERNAIDNLIGIVLNL